MTCYSSNVSLSYVEKIERWEKIIVFCMCKVDVCTNIEIC